MAKRNDNYFGIPCQRCGYLWAAHQSRFTNDSGKLHYRGRCAWYEPMSPEAISDLNETIRDLRRRKNPRPVTTALQAVALRHR